MIFSAITPTYQREAFLVRLYAYFKAQTYAEKEWLIYDDSPVASAFFSRLDDPEVRYFHCPERVSIGEKRNFLISQACGGFIAHFDDDDFYAPDYLETMADRLSSCDFTKLSAWYVYSEAHDFWGYFDAVHPAPVHYHLKANGPVRQLPDFRLDPSMLWGYGFSYAYRRTVWERFPFEPLNFGEDHTLVLERLLESDLRLTHFADTAGLVLHLLHRTNASEAFPQQKLTAEETPPVLWTPVQQIKNDAEVIRRAVETVRIA